MENTQTPVILETLPGYRKDAKGRLVPESAIAPIDQARDELVQEIIKRAAPLQEALRQFKRQAIGDIEAFVELSAEKYGARVGGQKGNVTLMSFDGQFKVQLKQQEHVNFDERIEAAKDLIDNCLERWTEGSGPELKAVVQRAFRTNRKGELRVAEILSLRTLEINDDEWQRAMAALIDSITVANATTYLNLYERVGDTGQWKHISLDMATL